MAYIHEHQENDNLFPNIDEIETTEDLAKRKRVRKLLETRLEQLSLKHELEDYAGELEDKFDWSNF